MADDRDDELARFFEEETDETVLAQRRLPERTYGSKSFDFNRPASRDHGKKAMFVRKVFDGEVEATVRREGTEWLVQESPGGRRQIQLLIVGEPGDVKELWIQRVPAPGVSGQIRTALYLNDRESIRRLIQFVKNLDVIPMQDRTTIRIDDAILRDVLGDQRALAALYREDSSAFRNLISSDASAKDVVAVAHRRAQVQRFRELLDDDTAFDEEMRSLRGPEDVWQKFFEANPWILGGSLTGQFLTSWDRNKLEQVVSGWNLDEEGRRADGVFRSAGRVRSMVLAEIKHHRTELLRKGQPYRNGCYPPSAELAGGVVQAQATVHQAARDLREHIVSKADDGSEIPGDYTYLFQPRSFLVVGRLDELTGEAGGDHKQKIRSFELFRRNLTSPEVLTFDEVLSRAEWLVGSPFSSTPGRQVRASDLP